MLISFNKTDKQNPKPKNNRNEPTRVCCERQKRTIGKLMNASGPILYVIVKDTNLLRIMYCNP